MNSECKARFSNGMYLHKSYTEFWEFILDLKSLKLKTRSGSLVESYQEDSKTIKSEEKAFDSYDAAILEV